MKYSIINGEKISDNEYKLITYKDHTYYYKCIDLNTDNFLKEDKTWRDRITEGQKILIEWIENREGTTPAYICWNREGRAMLEVKLKTIYNTNLEYNTYGSEINPFEYKDTEEWVFDEKCPLPNIKKSIVIKL